MKTRRSRLLIFYHSETRNTARLWRPGPAALFERWPELDSINPERVSLVGLPEFIGCHLGQDPTDSIGMCQRWIVSNLVGVIELMIGLFIEIHRLWATPLIMSSTDHWRCR